MPTKDIENVLSWGNQQAQSILTSRQYIQHFAELITRRLRLELSAERHDEPKYTHSLSKLEYTAHYFLNASRFVAETEAVVYSHEAAVLFEQVSDLLKHKNLPNGPDIRYNENQAVLSALMYYLAGYEANAIVLAEKYLKGVQPSDRSVYCACSCLFLSKQFMVLRQYINDIWNKNPLPDLNDYEDDSVLADFTFLAAERTTIHAAMHMMDYIRSGQEDEISNSLNLLSFAAQGYDACGDTVGALITRTLRLVYETLSKRSLHTIFANYQGNTDIIERYSRLLAAGNKPVSELWRSQLKFCPHILNEDQNAVISLPTSAGKTRLAEMAILRSLDRASEKRVLYLVPTRALAAEVELTLGDHFGPLGYRISALFGGYDLSDFEEQIIDDCHLLVTTPEKCDLLIRSKENFMSNVSLVICDEGHQVGSGTRGVTYEFVLSRILWHANMTSTRIVMLSAVLSNLDVVSEWLHAGISQSDRWKPTRSRLVYFGWNGNNGQLSFLDDELKVGSQYAFVPGILDRKNTQKSRDGWIGSLAIHFAGVGTTLVFSPKPVQCETLAKKVFNIAKKSKIESLSGFQDTIDKEHIPVIKQVIGKNHLLVKCLSRGIAFHHGRLPHSVRVRIERMVRSGLVTVIVANETLAQGINLPIKVIIIDKLSRGSGDNLVSVRDFWNIAGRAGRAGKEVEGYIVFVQDGDDGHIQHYIFRYFAEEQYEPITSVLLSTIWEALLPKQYEIWEYAKELQRVGHTRFAVFWPAAIDLTVKKAQEMLLLKEYSVLRDALEAELREKLTPGYRYSQDREHWADVLIDALKRILLSDILPFDEIIFTSEIWKKLVALVDSQLLAMVVEDILANQEEVDEFLATTLLGTEMSTFHPLFKAFGKGLQARYSYIYNEVPDPDSRKLFNSTGLSVSGNKIIDANIDILVDALNAAIADPSLRQDAIEQILSTAHEIPDLEPEEVPPRTLDLILDWVAGKSLEDIAKERFDSNMGVAVRTIERDIVRKIAWGVNACIQHIKATDFHVDDIASWLNNIPAMVGFGVPSPVAAFAAALGIASRNDCIALSETFAADNGDEKYNEFISWFSSLYQREDVISILNNTEDIKSILNLSEQRSCGYKGAPKKFSFRLSKDYGLADRQEVILFPLSEDGIKYTALTTKYSPVFDITPKDYTFHRWMQTKDYIARFLKVYSGGILDVEFV